MAKRRPSLPEKSPSPLSATGETPAVDAAPPTTLTADERLSPLFRSLRDIDLIEDPGERLQAALDRLDRISAMALGRERTMKNGEPILDPDCHAAVKVEEVAHRLLAIEPRKPKPRSGELDVFSTPLRAVK